MLLTGDAVDSATALRWNLVTRVVPAASLMTEAMALAQTIAERPPIAAEHAKINVRTARESSFSESMKYERDLQTVAFATDDAREGRRAFTEKRQGVFRRR
jgi:enoyl-CoA hydratase/carnithine racemase